MPMTVKVDTGTLYKIIRSRGLQPRGRVQQVLTNEIYKQAEPYTPMRSKTLIRTAQVGKDHITYVQPYSRYVYFGKVMVGRAPKKVTNKSLHYGGGGKRGAMWIPRMWEEKKQEISKLVAKEAGGKSV